LSQVKIKRRMKILLSERSPETTLVPFENIYILLTVH